MVSCKIIWITILKYSELKWPVVKICFFYYYFQDDEFDTMIKAGEKIERLYAHWFDMVIENEDLNSAFEQLVN